MKNTHTPGPWHIGKTLVSNKDPMFYYTAIVNNAGTIRIANVAGVGEEESKANAAFIVRAVNCHEELVDLLRDSAFMLQHQCADIGSEECVGCKQQMKIEQSIAKAEGKS